MQSTAEERAVLKADTWDEWRKLETDQKKGIPVPPVEKPYAQDALLVDLVPAEKLTVGQTPLIDVIRRRRSRRQFLRVPLTLEELSFLLWATQGVSKVVTQEDGRVARAFRTVPSGGCRHPFETYLFVNRVDGVAPGLYRYLPLEHRLCLVRPGAELVEKVHEATNGQYVLDCAVVFIWTAIPYRTEWRYKGVAAKIIAQDSGHLCQNLYLASEAIGGGTCGLGAYNQAKMDAVLGVDGDEEFTIYVAPVGKIPWRACARRLLNDEEERMTAIRAYLEPLRGYALDPGQAAPPELQPWDSADPWAMDGAARRTLGLLLAADEPAQRLFDMADYLFTFCVAGDRAQSYPDALLLNGTALALCGYLCEGRHPEAHIWRLCGAARLTTEMHTRKAALENHIGAECLLAVCRVADDTGLPILADLITLRERMWGRLLDHSHAEALHVPEAAYPSYMKTPVPADMVGALMRSRAYQQNARLPEYMLSADIEQAEQTINNLITLSAHMRVRHQFGSEIDWYLRLFDDVESTVSLNSQRCITNQMACYVKTGDERYARDARRLLWSWYRQCPVPNYRHLTGPWRTLEVGGRPWYTWMDVIGWLGQTEAFDEATHAMLARSRLEHIRYLMAFCGGPNNWYQVEASGLGVCALYSPELKDSDTYLRVALRRLKWINSLAYFDDGFQFELTHGYHVFPTNALFALALAAKARGVALPRDFMALAEKANEMYLYASQPDHLLPTFNDSNAHPVDHSPTLRFAGEVFGRADLLWGGTHGKEGTPPDHASHAWQSAGYYVMRDKWGKDGQHLFFDGAPWGASHQHEDKLSFTLYSHGRLLIGDPNIYSYAQTELTHYFKSSRGHNLVMVDGKGQARRYLGRQAWLKSKGKNEWVSRPGFDFVSSEYLEGYAPDPFPAIKDPVQVDLGISQRRAIFYVKPGYWILCDRIRGQDSKAHTLEQIFHLAPLFALGSETPLRAGEVSATPAATVTTNAGAANIAMLPADTEGVSVRAQKGETSPAVGWFGVEGEFPSWDVTLERSASLPARMDAVLFPLAPGQTALPTVTRLLATDKATALRIVGDGIDDTFILCEEGAGPVSADGVTFEGRAVLVRRHGALRALAVAPAKLEVDGRAVAADV